MKDTSISSLRMKTCSLPIIDQLMLDSQITQQLLHISIITPHPGLTRRSSISIASVLVHLGNAYHMTFKNQAKEDEDIRKLRLVEDREDLFIKKNPNNVTSSIDSCWLIPKSYGAS